MEMIVLNGGNRLDVPLSIAVDLSRSANVFPPRTCVLDPPNLYLISRLCQDADGARVAGAYEICSTASPAPPDAIASAIEVLSRTWRVVDATRANTCRTPQSSSLRQ